MYEVFGDRAQPTIAAGAADGRAVRFGRYVVLGLKPGHNWPGFLQRHNLAPAFSLADFVAAIETANAGSALDLAQTLAALPEVAFAYPEKLLPLRRHGAYAPLPNDPLFGEQWSLENRATNGTPLGPDLNLRAAWPLAQGAGITVAIGDGGIDLAHRDLTNRAFASLHYNFDRLETNGWPASAGEAHGTHVAGMLVAENGNDRGLSGIAPKARFVSWVIITANGNFVSDLRLAQMYQYRIHTVAVQNHSWNNSERRQALPTPAEETALNNACTLGRNGRGVIMVRPAGNMRADLLNANDDGYMNDPRVVAVGGLRQDGRVSSYSVPGTCLLAAIPTGDIGFGFPAPPSTDPSGAAGMNSDATGWPANDSSDYVHGTGNFQGTSFACAQMAGLAALVLSANTNLTIRDFQQVLLLSARHIEFTDPALKTNAAGRRVSHNLGYGIPDSGLAVRLARQWSNRPPATNISVLTTNLVPIPDSNGLAAATITLEVTNSLSCEWVGLRLKTDHRRRGDLRITLESPAGTVSELQHTNYDVNAGPSDWTYWTCHHFFEPSAGGWRLRVADESPGFTGNIRYAELLLRGIAIGDTNRNGLDDAWEQSRLLTASGDLRGDPDGDGDNNAVEQVLGTDPLAANDAMQLDLSAFNGQNLRLSWPGSTNRSYQLFTSGALHQWPTNFLAIPGRFPETEWFLPATNPAAFFKVRHE